MEFIEFSIRYQNKKQNSITFKNKYGKDPYFINNKLCIPIEILNEVFLENYNFKNKKKLNKEKLNDKIDNESEDHQIECNEEDSQTRNKLSIREPSGLVNLGGICYMNAVLQCFYYCWPLTKYFLNINKNEKLGPISEGYYELVKGLSLGNKKAALKFKSAMIENDDTFIGNDGKDSKDVAILLLCELHNELNKNSDSIQKEDKNLDHTNLLKVYKDKNDFEDKNKTIISKTFNFFIKYEHKCTKNCKIYNQKYYTMESDNIIIFELEKIYKDINSRSNNRSYGSYGSYGNYGSYGEEPEISLEECLKHYSKTEIIECPYCKTRTLNIKKTICTLPKIIIFVLRRGLNIKFDCKILYKSELDMKDFYEEIPGLFNGINTKYQLCCATFAYDWTKGTIHTGHTVAFCKTYKGKENKPQYYIFNDSRPIKSDIDEIENKTPYLLFYERCDK